MAVYELLCRCASHPTAEELFRLVKPTLDTLSLATVYNTLETLTRAGLVKLSPHVHLRFRDTSSIDDVPPWLSDELLRQFPKTLLQQVGTMLGVEIDGVNIQLVASHNGVGKDSNKG
jgi:hypothetical protein